MKKKFQDAIEDSPVIAAINSFESLETALTCESRIIFILFGNICNIADIVAKVKSVDKIAMVHIDLILGLAPKEIAVDFIHQCTQADGIISTKPSLIKRACKLSMFTVLRFFVIDSLAFSNIEKQLENIHPDVVELLPALMPRVLGRLCEKIPVPVITGGLIADKEDVVSMLSAGATCVSSTNTTTWFL